MKNPFSNEMNNYTEIQQKESQHKALLDEVQKHIISAQNKQEQYDKKHSKTVVGKLEQKCPVLIRSVTQVSSG